MNMKKILLYVSMAVAAVAFAAPASASAMVWTAHGEPVTGPESLELDGVLSSSFGGMFGFSCNAHADATVAPSVLDESEIKSFEYGPCEMWGSSQGSTCEVESVTGGGPVPWEPTESEEIKISGSELELTATIVDDMDHENPACSLEKWIVKGDGDETAVPDNPAEMSSITLDAFTEQIMVFVGGYEVEFSSVTEFDSDITPAGVFGMG